MLWSWWRDGLGFLTKGGVVMVPLAVLSTLALAVTVERFLYLRRRRIMPVSLYNQVKDYLAGQDFNAAVAVCKADGSSFAQILLAGLEQRQFTTAEIRGEMENAGKRERANLERYFPLLQTVVGASPLLGLLGTVTGMIKTFQVIQVQGLGVTESLAGGIAEALVSTASGLVVAIPFFLALRYFQARSDRFILEMEHATEGLISLIKPRPQP